MVPQGQLINDARSCDLTSSDELVSVTSIWARQERQAQMLVKNHLPVPAGR